ncbi:GNAT family N-acetyltransferase [Marinicella litoralis]|uniref:Putative N-acetyltransferase YhbS n=1 Tax=Marinicella litoralis TaxID=644220 RepID=A0A4R6XZS6_9GAMM|nr:GNAT family N-acetyltransferase [Marinicella litoralis]TDR23854.1 putative N-acetyltransferase YhbS [Marinicella litoralis]
MSVIITQAQAHDAAAIGALAVRSKAHWGYDEAFMQQVKAELTYQANDIQQHPTFIASKGSNLLGFYQLIAIDSSTAELDALFVDPDFIGQGVGAQLFSHAVTKARAKHHLFLKIQSDPYAADFYRKQGCLQVGTLESLSIPGRLLPLMVYPLV